MAGSDEEPTPGPSHWEPGPNATYDEILQSFSELTTDERKDKKNRKRLESHLAEAEKRERKKGKKVKKEDSDDESDEVIYTPPDHPLWNEPAYQPTSGRPVPPDPDFPGLPDVLINPNKDNFHPVERPGIFDGEPKSFIFWQSSWLQYLDAHPKGFRTRAHLISQVMSTISHETGFTTTISILSDEIRDKDTAISRHVRSLHSALDVLRWILNYIRELVLVPAVYQECMDELNAPKGNRKIRKWIIDMDQLGGILNIEADERARIMISKMNVWFRTALEIATGKSAYEITYQDIRLKGPSVEMQQTAIWEATKARNARRALGKTVQGNAATATKRRRWPDQDYALIMQKGGCLKCGEPGHRAKNSNCEQKQTLPQHVRVQLQGMPDIQRKTFNNVPPPNNL